ncbi:MAG: M28 family peptidase [Bryobacteraceae bacterium]
MKIVVSLVFFILALIQALPAQEISGPRIKAHVKFLAGDLLEGRGVGTRGGRLTEEYLAAQLAAVGAKPAGEDGKYFQTVRLVGVTTAPDSLLTASKDGKSLPFKWEQDFVGASHRQKGSEEFEAPLVFVGHGIVAPEQNWNDYKDADVRGKIVVLFTNEPQPDNPEVFKGRTLTYYGRWTYKYEQALRQGALGALIIHTTPTAGYGWEVVRNSWGKEDPQMKLGPDETALSLAGWLTQEAGEQLLKMAGHTVDNLLKASDAPDFQPISLGINLEVRLRADIRPVDSRNVLGLIEGSDPKLKDEVVVFSAHWDHLGIGVPVGDDAIYNGAIDNATGCGIVLETARVWDLLKQKPRRSALFLFVTAEESGLRGSEYYAQHPLIPPGKTAIAINYDALFPSARTMDIVVTGAERTTAWTIVQEAAHRYELEIQPDPRPEQGSYYRSDHFMFARAGIPAFSVKTGSKIYGKPEDHGEALFREFNTKHYHQPSDEFKEDWDFASIEHASRFGFLVGLNIANSSQLPTWLPGDEFLAAREASRTE